MFFWVLELPMGEEGASSKVIAKVPAEFECVASTLKFKRHKVSALRDFLPGCGRVVAPISGTSGQPQPIDLVKGKVICWTSISVEAIFDKGLVWDCMFRNPNVWKTNNMI